MREDNRQGWGWFSRLRAWNRRQVAWTRRHPWWSAAMFATAYCGPWLWSSLRGGVSFSLPTIALMWVVLFVTAGVSTRARARRPVREPMSTPPTDMTLRGDSGPGMGEDGRRWRTGRP